MNKKMIILVLTTIYDLIEIYLESKDEKKEQW